MNTLELISLANEYESVVSKATRSLAQFFKIDEVKFTGCGAPIDLDDGLPLYHRTIHTRPAEKTTIRSAILLQSNERIEKSLSDEVEKILQDFGKNDQNGLKISISTNINNYVARILILHSNIGKRIVVWWMIILLSLTNP